MTGQGTATMLSENGVFPIKEPKQMRAPLSKILPLFVFLMMPLMAVPAQAADTARATAFIQKLGDSAIGILADKSLPEEQASKKFRDILHDNFDLNMLGKFALGPTTWKGLNEKQKEEYMRLFETLVVGIYSDRFKTYSGETFMAGTAKSESATDSYVTSFIVKPDSGTPPTQVDWRVRETGGSHRIIDVIVEGVSMSVTKRSEFSAAISQQGGDFNAFLELLRAKVKEGDTSIQNGN
jgi:phospholipid transport system substrate-binding protein